MAAYHVRSNSFPSKKHPIIPEFDALLCRLRSSEATSSSSSYVSSNLNGLQDLHDCLDKLLSLPLNQQALSKEQNQKKVDVVLDGSLRLLDLCNTAKDALLQMKESTQELQSAMRRKHGGEISLSSEVKKFLSCRKMMKKALSKAMENKSKFTTSSVKKEQDTPEIVSILREVELITFSVFESMVSFVSESKSSKSNSWSLVSKVMNSRRVACEGVKECNEFTSANGALANLISKKTKKTDNKVEEINAQNELQSVESCIQDLEQGVENLYRRLIKTRVSLLNILNH
ncbi:uncharacterized protein LOC115716677 [Cannabis sativa]|uniref:uncharacterized protein LOC115716677 n=1 Tax=Cannabis sativa TaxID=3483 RepID=UPI0029CA0686|nr:uncharacterized protein LOC115716677 [Cannabis sativa]